MNNKIPVPYDKSVLVERVKLEIEASLFLPETAKSPQNEGIVAAVGPNVKPSIKVGMRVVYNKLSNQFVTYGGKTWHVVHEDDVYAEVIDGRLHAKGMRIFVDRDTKEMQLNSGIILPGTQKVQMQGKVVAAGELCQQVKVGDLVILSSYVDHEIMFGTKTLTLTYEGMILAMIPEGAYAGTEDHGRERRPDIPLDQLPDIETPEKFKSTIHFDPKA